MKDFLAAMICLVISVAVVDLVPGQSFSLSYSGVSGQNNAIWVVYEAGLFKKYGLNAEMLIIAGGVTHLQALLAGEIAS